MTPDDVRAKARQIRAAFQKQRTDLEHRALHTVDDQIAAIDAQMAMLRDERNTLVAQRAAIYSALREDEVTLADAIIEVLTRPMTDAEIRAEIRQRYGDMWEPQSVQSTRSTLVRDSRVVAAANTTPKKYERAQLNSAPTAAGQFH